MTQAQRAWREANRERIRKWRRANRERIREYRRVNRERIRKWRRANREERLKQQRKWNRAHPERLAFIAARRRCTNPNAKEWKNYGGRGIQFKFTSYEQFFAELGPRPKEMTLDRIDTRPN